MIYYYLKGKENLTAGQYIHFCSFYCIKQEWEKPEGNERKTTEYLHCNMDLTTETCDR